MDLTTKSDELKRLIAEHPDYDIAVLAGENAYADITHQWMFCSDITFEVGEIFDAPCTPLFDGLEYVIVDREDLAEWIYDSLSDDTSIVPECVLEAKLKELEPYWKKAIVIYANN